MLQCELLRSAEATTSIMAYFVRMSCLRAPNHRNGVSKMLPIFNIPNMGTYLFQICIFDTYVPIFDTYVPIIFGTLNAYLIQIWTP